MSKVVIALAVAGVSACTEISSDPPIDCNSFHPYFIELDPAPSGVLVDYQINVGDSIRLTGSVRREDSSTPIFNPQQGWYCVTTTSSPVSAVVTFTTNDTQVLRIGANGWIRGLSFGSATVVASSVTPAVSADIGFFVYSP